MRKVRDRETKWLGQGSEDQCSEPKWAGSKQCSSKCWSVLLHGTWMELMQIRDSPSALLPSAPPPPFCLHLCVSLSTSVAPLLCVYSFLFWLQPILPVCSVLPFFAEQLSLLLISAPFNLNMAHHSYSISHQSLSHWDFLVQNPNGQNPTGSVLWVPPIQSPVTTYCIIRN